VSNKASSKKAKVKDKSKKTILAIGAVILAGLLLIVVYYYMTSLPPASPSSPWSLDSSGHLTFPARGAVQANSTPSDLSSNNYTVETIVYKSFGDDVYASLMIPKNVTKPPVVIVLPAATITKELDLPMAQYLSGMGYASLTLDERGNRGQTGGMFAGNWTDGFDSYMNGGTPIQYKQIYDVLKGLDYVKSRSDLNGSDTAVLGESIGGMWSIISAGVEPQLKGVVCVSSSSFNFPTYDDANANAFLKSVEPSTYLSLLPPRKLVMIHFTNDTTIPIQDGKALFNNASQPKAWYQYEGSTHGLPNATYMPDLQRELQGMLGK
jgi:uncharacterized protein